MSPSVCGSSGWPRPSNAGSATMSHRQDPPSAATLSLDLVRRAPLLSPALLAVFVAVLGGETSFYLLLSVVPQFSASLGAGEAGAGASNGALLLATVVVEILTPALVARAGYRAVLATGLVLLGAPALLLGGASGLGAIVWICMVRGAGFAVIVVLGSALVAASVPPGRRGEGLGLYGAVVGVPAIVALPFGVWLAPRAGYGAVFTAAAGAAFLGLLAVPLLPTRDRGDRARAGMLAILGRRELTTPAVTFSLTAMATGIVVTFLAMALPEGSAAVVSVALVLNALASAVSRWVAGVHADRPGSSRSLAPGVALGALAMLILALTGRPAAVVSGMILLGVGFGMAQNASLTGMYDGASSGEYDAVSALWNLAYDAGMGLGAAGFGVAAQGTGYAAGFLATAALMLLGAALARRTSDPRVGGAADDTRNSRGEVAPRAAPVTP